MVEPLYEVLARSALVSLTAAAIASVIGIPLGTALALGRVPGRRLTTAVVNTGMAVPTVVVNAKPFVVTGTVPAAMHSAAAMQNPSSKRQG